MDVNVRAKVYKDTDEVYINANDMILFWQQVCDTLKDEVVKTGIKDVVKWVNEFKNDAQANS